MSDNSPFFHYNSSFDAIATIERHAVTGLQADPDFVTNFLGVKISPRFFPGILDGWGGVVEPIPVPANWHADIAEWAAALRAVDCADRVFRVAELGCGWGCWLNMTGVAAKRVGLKVYLIGVEGDEGHVEFAHESLGTNGFGPDEYRIIHGIAAPTNGKALFPIAETSGQSWGLEPVFGASQDQIRAATTSGSHQILDMYTLRELADGKPLDLLHIDIQGGELDFVSENLSDLGTFVRRMVIGTHSRQIEGAIMGLLLAAGWRLEIERPAIFTLAGGQPQTTVDGVQGWVNEERFP